MTEPSGCPLHDKQSAAATIAAQGAAAIILPRKNANPRKPDSAGALAIAVEPMANNGLPRNEALRASRRFGRTIWRRW